MKNRIDANIERIDFDIKFEKTINDMLKAYHNWRWISVDDELPKMCETVIVQGIIDKTNIGFQIYEARRWTGWTSGWPGINEGKEPPWEWLTPQDTRIAEVKYWMPLPKNPLIKVKEQENADDRL